MTLCAAAAHGRRRSITALPVQSLHHSHVSRRRVTGEVAAEYRHASSWRREPLIVIAADVASDGVGAAPTRHLVTGIWRAAAVDAA